MENLKFYIVNVGGFVDVVDYATYETIKLINLNKSGELEEAKKFLIELSKMNNHAYIDMLMKVTKSKNVKDLLKDRDKDKEDWIKGAWLQVTNCTLKELNLDINLYYNKSFSEVLEEYKKVEEYNRSIEVNNLNYKRKKPLKSNKSTKLLKPSIEANNTSIEDDIIKPKTITKKLTKHGEVKHKKPNKLKKRKLVNI